MGKKQNRNKHRNGVSAPGGIMAEVANFLTEAQTQDKKSRTSLPTDNAASASASASTSRDPSESSGSKKRSSPHGAEDSDKDDGWQTIERGRAVKKQKKVPSADSSRYPAITFSDQARLQAKINLSAIRDLILYILADGTAPQRRLRRVVPNARCAKCCKPSGTCR